MGITSANKELSTTQIDCGDSLQITLSLTAAPDIVSNPTDIVLVLDHSSSMAGSPLANLKNGAKKFIEIIDAATDDTHDGQIGNGSRIGIVSFSTTATQDTQLITSVADLDAAVNALTSGGMTNHAEAFAKAVKLFDMTSPNAKVIVLFTDGVTTTGADATPIADAAKAEGILIYCIGLSGDTGIDETALNQWASQPASAYVSITPDDAELETLFADLAKNIAKPGATEITVVDHIDTCFRVLSLGTITKGTASIVNDNEVKWEIDALGTTASEGASLTFAVQHIGSCTGEMAVNTAVNYSDCQNNMVTFPLPKVEVVCNEPILGEECPKSVNVTMDGCVDSIEYDAGDLSIESNGRILQLDVVLKNICPNKRVALGVIVTEVDAHDLEYKRGMKTLVIPAQTGTTCKDVTVRCIKFVLPEVLNVSGSTDSICNERKFKVRFIAHYIDTDFACCSVSL